MMANTSGSDIQVIKDQLEVLSIAEGFFQSSILFSLLKLRVFERVGEESKTLAELASELKSRPETLARLLNAGVVLKLLESKDGTSYRVGRAFRSTLLPSAGEKYLGDWISNLDYFRSALSELDQAILKSAPTVNPSHHLGADKEQTREFTLAMHNYASLRGKELAHFLHTTGCKTLLDLGCGPGTYAFHLGMRNPDLQLYLLDLPEVLEVAREVQSRYPMKNEVHYLPKDATQEEVPGSYDMILVSNTLHMLGEEASRLLIRRLFDSINQRGSLVIQAQYLQDSRLGGRWPVFLDLIQLCITSAGRNHSVSETKTWLEEAGFTNIQYRSMSIYNTNSFLRGYKTERI
jgi:cyclopropane fatty-acyl-phospholipid synthase-like methyltransferase